MAFIDDTWMRKAHQALRATFDVDAHTRRDMIQFLYDEGFWDESKLAWSSAESKFNDNCNPSKEAFWKLGEVWALTLRFNRPQLFLAMAESLGFEVRALPTEERRIALLEKVLDHQVRSEARTAELVADLERLCAQPIEKHLQAHPAVRPHFSLPGTPDGTAVGRIGAL